MTTSDLVHHLDPELLRQRAVDALQLIGTPAEERFDRITRIAQRVFGVPIATVTLVDHDRLWFKSCAGMDVPEAPRQASFCDRTVSLAETLVVPDTFEDPRFADTPAVTHAPHIRFYAGHPLLGPAGQVVGTFCLFDVRPRRLDTTQLALLEELGEWAQRELAHSAEMERAQQVQRGLLPSTTPDVPGWDVDGLCIPAQAIGGDLYDHELVPGGLALTVADVMGKGTGAAILMATVRAVLRGAARTAESRPGRGGEPPWAGVSLGRVFAATNRDLEPDLARSGSFVTAFHARLDPETGVLRYVDAGHGLSLVLRADGSTEHLSGGDLPLGLDRDATWTERQLVLLPGDTLAVFSDGLFDILGGTTDSLDDLAALVRRDPEPAAVVAAVRELTAVSAPLDDVTVLAVRRRPDA
ncbi:MAG: putative protein kinase/phosphatase regulator hybrid protein [Klenkia sp.]|nr:putative protein kinase/phosphatase regulator hybrid protein [Klenkia sp.]